MKERSKRAISLCAVVLTAAVLTVPIASMVGIINNAEAAEEESVLKVGFMQKIDSLNPYLGLSDAAYVFYGLVYDYMQSVGNDMEAVPNLATDSRIIDLDGYPHGSVWEYTITPNARWHDGEPVTAEDIAWNFNLNCMETNYSDMWAYQPYMYFAKYAEITPEGKVRVTYFDRENGTVIPCAYAYLIGTPMVPEHLLGTFGTSFISFQWPGYFTDTTPKLVGTGPFMVTSDVISEFTKGDQLTLVRNPNYHWLADKGMEVKFDKLIMYFYDDDTAMKIALEQGQLDVAQFPPNTFRSIEDDIASGSLKNVDSYSGLKCTQYWTEIGFNMNNGGPNKWRLDPLARHALAQAVNKTYIINNFYKGYGREGTGLISPVTPYWHWEPNATEHWDYSLTVAAAALEAAGYVDSDDPDSYRECTVSSAAVQNNWCLEGAKLKLEMMIRMEYPEEKEIAKYLQEQWAQIGVELSYDIMLEDVLAKNCYNYGYDTMIWYWSADPDPNFMLFCQSKKSINGWSDNAYTNPAYEENYSNSIMEFDDAKRQEYVHNCQRISYQDAAYILIAYVYSTYAWRTDTFTGWGDWAADPARSLDAFWTANPLFFDLEYTPQQDQVIPLWVIIAAVGIAAAVVVGAVFMLRRGKKKREIGGDEGGSPLGD